MSLTLLAATDFSAPARHTVERAAQLAHAHPGARLTLAHIVPDAAPGLLRYLLPGEADTLAARQHDEARQQLDALAASLSARWPSRIDTVLGEGVALDGLAALVDAQPPDLLVMGVRGAHFVREWLIGSTTERVLRKLKRPLLAVRQRPQAAYRRILAPVDFSAHAEAAIRVAHAWLPRADIVLLHAFGVEHESTFRLAGMEESRIHDYRIQARDAAAAELESFIARLDLPAAHFTRVLAHGPASLRILEHEQTTDADLIVMGKRGLSMIEEMLLGSVTQQVLARASSDVLTAAAA